MRRASAAAGIALLLAAPLAAAAATGLAPGALAERVLAGMRSGIEQVGWVFVPQLVLGSAVLGVAFQQLAHRAARLGPAPAPGWLDAAVESALLLGMLGTISGMVNGFAGLSPERLEPGPLVHSLGTALRSSLVGFLIALVGVWLRTRPGATDPEPEAA